MLRLRIVVPLVLLSSLATPAFGASNTSHCAANPNSPRCEAERAREFAAARNAEINASIAAVSAARARIALSMTHCKTAASTTPRCETERARELALSLTHCKSGKSATPRCQAERANELALSTTHCKSPNSTTPRCQAQRVREFAAARNAEIDRSIAMVQMERAHAFAAARNAEIRRSIAAVEAERTRAFEQARNAEINASIAAVKTERARTFAAARNTEINKSIAAVSAQRALSLAINAARPSIVETGAISLPESLNLAKPAPAVRHARHLGPCREATGFMSPLEFSQGNAEIEPAMKPELDRIAMMARSCPAIRLEIHGHSDNAGPSQINRHLAQRRAEAAVEYLVASGIDSKRLVAIGHAAARPLLPNTNEDNRAINRRIEVTIYDPAMQAAAQRVMWDLAELLDPTYVPPLARLSP